jgi:hypothetical protein
MSEPTNIELLEAYKQQVAELRAENEALKARLGEMMQCICSSADLDKATQRADRAEARVHELQAGLVIAETAFEKLAHDEPHERANRAEAAAAQMREFVSAMRYMHMEPSKDAVKRIRAEATECLATDAGRGWVPIEVLREACELIGRFGYTSAERTDIIRKAEAFLAKYGDKLKPDPLDWKP